ncbi:MAG: glycosyltransferase family 2 protein [Anaerolineae bacterium]|nr:glycosyltransferase family 2 protein [Anaerolineae bacterium]
MTENSSTFVSVLVPAKDEADNIPTLVEKVGRAFAALGVRGELVLVDDGSSDGTGEVAAALQADYPFLRLIRHRRNLGMTAALRTGFRAVRGDVILFLPADLESDPEEDIPKLLARLDEGYDVVAGWRQGRQGGKVVTSAIYNAVSRLLFGVPAHDMNWIKGFRRQVMETLPPLRSDWHRFLLHIAAHQGYRIGEVRTNWYPRQAGRSHFGLSRIPISLLDVLVIRFLLTFSQAPMRFFGGLGLTSLAISAVTFLVLAYFWFFQEQTQKRPIFWLAGGLALAGLLLILVGFVAELIVSTGERLEVLERKMEEGRWRETDDGRYKGHENEGTD